MNTKIQLLSLLWVLMACTPKTEKNTVDSLEQKEEWELLIDKDLSNWDTYLSFQHEYSYDGTPPKNEDGTEKEPIGFNNAQYQVFSTFTENNEVIIKNTGEYYGCLITKKEYENYHFQLQYKWGEKKWMPRTELLRDSGILYHSIGTHGAEYWRSWMLSQEFQIMEGHSGDYWSQATSSIDIRAYKPESNIDPLAHYSQDFLTIGKGSSYKNYCMRSGNFEKQNSEWNTLDLYCFNDKSIHMVNGEVVMILKNSRYTNESGNEVPLTKGKIQLQSEAAEVYFKGIKIQPINELPEALQKLY